MVDTLRHLAEARALLPDNASNLVSPQDVREYLLALEPDRGGYSLEVDDGPAVIALDQGVWTEINATTVPGILPPTTAVRWTNDGLSRPVPDWGPDVTVPAGFLRSSRISSTLSIDPIATTNDTFEVAASYGGVVDEAKRILFVVDANQEIEVVPFGAEHRLIVDGTQYVALVIRNVSGGGDLALYDLRLEVTSRAYEEPPV